MKFLDTIKTINRVLGATGYHLTYGAVASPSVTREFFQTVANTIVDFRPAKPLALSTAWVEDLFHDIEAQSVPYRMGRYTQSELPISECLTITALVRHLKPLAAFEIGTYLGRTTRLIAEHAPTDAVVYTLDLPFESKQARTDWQGQIEQVDEARHHQSLGPNIVRLFGNSRTFDFSPYYGRMDLVYVDGDHSYEGVASDTVQAMHMVKPGGLVIWDDYHAAWPGVVRCLEETATTHELQHLAMTRLACYRAPVPR